MNCQSAFQQIAQSCLASLRRHRARASRGNPEAIHQIRIALTRLRAARKFFAAMTRDTTWPKLKARIDWLNAALGPARDSDVLTEFASTQRKRLRPARDQHLLTRDTTQTHRRLALVLRSKRCDQLIVALGRWIDNGPWSTSDGPANVQREQLLCDFAPDRLERWKRRLVRESADGLGKGRRRHRLRIAAKHYRYMSDALAALGLPEDRNARHDREAASAMQGSLGDLRDLQRFRKLQPERLAAGIYRRRKKRLLRRAERASHRLS
jgi:CHAD domain-containing protein